MVRVLLCDVFAMMIDRSVIATAATVTVSEMKAN